VFICFNSSFSFTDLFSPTDPGAAAVQSLLSATPFQDDDQAIMRSHVLFLACSMMYQVAQFADLEYDSYLQGLPDETQRLLFGLQLISSKGQPIWLNGIESRDVFYHMLAYRRASCLHDADPQNCPMPSRLIVADILTTAGTSSDGTSSDGATSGGTSAAVFEKPPSFEEIETLASAARGRYRAELRAAASVPSSTSASAGKVYLLDHSGASFSLVELCPSRKCVVRSF
jgi:hypothetical protein